MKRIVSVSRAETTMLRAMGFRRGGKTGVCSPGNSDEEPNISRKPEVSNFVSSISLTAYLRHLK